MARDALEALAKRVGAQLQARDLKLVTAESCTGGWVAQAVTSVAGSSRWFERGFVTYSDQAKKELRLATTVQPRSTLAREAARYLATLERAGR